MSIETAGVGYMRNDMFSILNSFWTKNKFKLDVSSENSTLFFGQEMCVDLYSRFIFNDNEKIEQETRKKFFNSYRDIFYERCVNGTMSLPEELDLLLLIFSRNSSNIGMYRMCHLDVLSESRHRYESLLRLNVQIAEKISEIL